MCCIFKNFEFLKAIKWIKIKYAYHNHIFS